jgi:hypothetical protein
MGHDHTIYIYTSMQRRHNTHTHEKTNTMTKRKRQQHIMMRTVWTILVWMHCIGTTIRIVESAPTGGEWYHECKSGNCGYNHAAAYPSSSSSSSCRDDREQCVDYARRGECFANPGWMHVYCQRSCGLCDNSDDINDDDDVGNDCRDKHSNCPQW